MKRSAIKKVGKVTKRRNAALAKWKKNNPCPATCPICGRAPDWRGLSIHHITHRSQGGDESEDNLTWACGRCHDQMHGIKEG